MQKVSLDDLGMNTFLKRITLYSSGGPFLEGYVLGVIGVALPLIVSEFRIDEHWNGLLGVASLVGLFFGASIGGWLTDLLGRKRMFIIDIAAIGILSIISAFVASPLQLFIVRFLIGLAVGADYPIATSMIAEFTPRRYRAISMGFIAAMWYIGANASYIVGYFLLDLDGGWRWMLASSIIPCLIILIGRWSIPESPRWLMSKGRTDEAEGIMESIFHTPVQLEDETAEKTDVRTLLRRTYLKRIIFVGVIWLCQAIPMYAVYTYGPQIISGFGFGAGRQALIGEIIIGTFFMIGTIPAMFLAEYWGRRPLIIWSFVIMTASLAVLGVIPAPSLFVVVACFAIYAIASGGPGNLQWLYPNELFPTSVRATAMGAAMALSRIGTVVSIYVLPTFLATHGTGKTMLVGAAISMLGLAISVAWAPETSGYPLTETASEGFNARTKAKR